MDLQPSSVIVMDSLSFSLCELVDAELCWLCSCFLITALICLIYAVCRVSSSAWALTRVADPNAGQEELLPASAAGLGSQFSEIALVKEQGRWLRRCLRVFGVTHRPQSHVPLATNELLWGLWPKIPRLVLFIEWKLTYNLIFHWLIFTTEAASCQRGDGRINGNLVGGEKGLSRGRHLIDRSPASSWHQDRSRSMRKAVSFQPHPISTQLPMLACFYT